MSLVAKLSLQLLQGLLGAAKLVGDAGQVGCLLIMPASTYEHALLSAVDAIIGVATDILMEACCNQRSSAVKRDFQGYAAKHSLRQSQQFACICIIRVYAHDGSHEGKTCAAHRFV